MLSFPSQVLSEEAELRDALAAQTLANAATQRRVHELTLELTAAKKQLTAKRVADTEQYMWVPC